MARQTLVQPQVVFLTRQYHFSMYCILEWVFIRVPSIWERLANSMTVGPFPFPTISCRIPPTQLSWRIHPTFVITYNLLSMCHSRSKLPPFNTQFSFRINHLQPGSTGICVNLLKCFYWRISNNIRVFSSNVVAYKVSNIIICKWQKKFSFNKKQ